MVGGLPHAVSSGMASKVLPRFQPGCIAATVAIAVPGCGDVDGDAEGDADGAVLAGRLGDGEVLPSTAPVQATPLSANVVGAGLLPDQDAFEAEGDRRSRRRKTGHSASPRGGVAHTELPMESMIVP